MYDHWPINNAQDATPGDREPESDKLNWILKIADMTVHLFLRTFYFDNLAVESLRTDKENKFHCWDIWKMNEKAIFNMSTVN